MNMSKEILIDMAKKINWKEYANTLEWIKTTRPWWWFINPWLYIKRRDVAYADALVIIEELSKDK
jgi:hypothetical protein